MAIHKIPLFCLTTVFILLSLNVAEAKRRQENNNNNRIARQSLDVEFEKPIDGLKRKKRELLSEFILKGHNKQEQPEIERVHKTHHNHKRAASNTEAKHKKWIKRDIEQFYELTNTPNFIYRQKRRNPNMLKEHVSHKMKRETNEAQIHNRRRRFVIISPDNILLAKNIRRDKRNVEAIEKKKMKKRERSSTSDINKHKKNLHKLDIHDNLYKKYKKHDAAIKKEKRHVKRYLNWREIMHQKRDQKRETKKAKIHAPEHNHLHREKRFEKREKNSKNLHHFKRNKSHAHSTKRQKKHL